MTASRQNLPANSHCCCSSGPTPPGAPAGSSAGSWNIRYFLMVMLSAAAWWLAYSYIWPLAHWFVFVALGFAPDSQAGAALEFFIYDTVKILLLLAALIYAVAWLRASLKVAAARDFLAGKGRAFGYFLGAVSGAITPFCSCSSIPLFLGFTTAGLPIGITMSFLITSPLINEIAVVLLWGLLGWKFTVAYVLAGLSAGIIGGFFMDRVRAGRWLQPFILKAMHNNALQPVAESGEAARLSARQRHNFALGETGLIFRRVWKWVIIGVGLGAALHGFVPENWFAQNLGAAEWWSVPASVLLAIPLYSNVTGIIPVMESLLLKGLPVGTTMAFCMSAVAASIPEVMMLRQIMTIKLQAAFIGYLWVIFTLAGWLFNIIGPHIL